MANASPQFEAVYQRVLILQQQADALPETQQAVFATAFEELQGVLEELRASEAEVHSQHQALIRTRQTVEAEQQRYQELFEFAPDSYLVTDANGKILEANAASATLLNLSLRFIIGKPLAVFIDQPERYSFNLNLDRLQHLDKRQDWEIRLRSQNRGPFDAALTVSAGHSADGHIVHFRWLLRDITQRKQVERLLEQLNSELERQVQERTTQFQQSLAFEAGLKRITDQVRDSLDESQILQAAVQELTLVLGLVCCDTALYNLDAATSTIQYEFTNFALESTASSPSTLGQVVPMTCLPEGYRQLLQGEYFQFCELDQPSTRHQSILAYPLCDDQGVLGDLWLFKPTEESFSDLELRLVKQVANQCAIAIRQARLFRESQAQIEALRKLDQLKDDFLSTTSHELRSPIANMKVAIRMVTIALAHERGGAELAPLETAASSVDRYLRILEAECDREVTLINDLLDLQRLEAENQPLTLTTIQLQDWLPPRVLPFRTRAQEHQQTLQLVIAPDLPPLSSDAETLERILAELLTNACKYTPAGGQIAVTVESQADAMQLTVSNTNVGLSTEDLPRLFDKFYRVPHADPWKHGGTGLGLALVQKLSEHLGSSLTVESGGGQLYFKLVLPVAAVA